MPRHPPRGTALASRIAKSSLTTSLRCFGYRHVNLVNNRRNAAAIHLSSGHHMVLDYYNSGIGFRDQYSGAYGGSNYCWSVVIRLKTVTSIFGPIFQVPNPGGALWGGSITVGDGATTYVNVLSRFNGGSANFNATGSGFGGPSFRTLVVVVPQDPTFNGSLIRAYIDGVALAQTASTTGSYSGFNWGPELTGIGPNNQNIIDGVECFGHWTRGLSDFEARAVSLDPYVVLADRSRIGRRLSHGRPATGPGLVLETIRPASTVSPGSWTPVGL